MLSFIMVFGVAKAITNYGDGRLSDRCWVVNMPPDAGERPWGIGFQNQTQVSLVDIDPAFVRSGVWTFSALEALADEHAIHDGWDEYLVMQLTFGRRRFEGTFVYNLLQDWREI